MVLANLAACYSNKKLYKNKTPSPFLDAWWYEIADLLRKGNEKASSVLCDVLPDTQPRLDVVSR